MHRSLLIDDADMGISARSEFEGVIANAILVPQRVQNTSLMLTGVRQAGQVGMGA
jgi:hypothetical protein